MTLNKITDVSANGYVQFEFYSKQDGSLSKTVAIPKLNVSSIQAFVSEDVVGIFTIPQVDQHTKGNSIIELTPSEWALSGSPTTPIADVATLLSTLLGYFSDKW